MLQATNPTQDLLMAISQGSFIKDYGSQGLGSYEIKTVLYILWSWCYKAIDFILL